jgi:hypothetical protein
MSGVFGLLFSNLREILQNEEQWSVGSSEIDLQLLRIMLNDHSLWVATLLDLLAGCLHCEV